MYCKQPMSFDTIEAFIERLKKKSEIIGLFQYGGRDYRDMSYGGDYDLVLIIDSSEPLIIGGLHLHIQHVPVDCAIMSLSELQGEVPEKDFNVVLQVSELIYDPKGILAPLHDKIKSKWISNIPFTTGEIEWERFLKQHVIDKFRYRVSRDKTYSHLFLNGNMFWLLEIYMRLNALPPCDFKKALSIMKERDSSLYNLYEEYHSTLDLERKLEISESVTKIVLKPVGGPWRDDEIIFHYNNVNEELSEEQKAEVLSLIF